MCVWGGGGIAWGRMVGCNVCVGGGIDGEGWLGVMCVCVGGGGGITWGRMVGCNVCVGGGGVGGGYNMGKDGWV